jgi:hypothetical protein
MEPESTLEDYGWNYDNLPVLKNVLVQTVWSLLYAYEHSKHLYMNIHVRDILLQNTKKTSLHYGGLSLDLLGLSIRIMDVGRPTTQANAVFEVYISIDRLLSHTLIMKSSVFALEYNRTLLTEMIVKNTPITQETYRILKGIIEGLWIRYDL